MKMFFNCTSFWGARSDGFMKLDYVLMLVFVAYADEIILICVLKIFLVN